MVSDDPTESHPTPETIKATRLLIKERGATALTVNDLTRADLPLIAWSGSSSHLRSVSRELDRAGSGEVEYLAVRAPDGYPIGKSGIDYTYREGTGAIYQLAVHSGLQSLGLGTYLISEAERRIRQRGLSAAILGVEDDNLRARALYERLGYRAYDHVHESWESEDADGNPTIHEAEMTLLRKQL